MAEAAVALEDKKTGFIRVLGLMDSTTIVAGSMIGSGIFIVSADMARQVGSPGWLLVAWVVTGLLTVIGALSYGELAAMMPKAGGQYVYLREAFSPMWGFLYGWTLFMVIQTGTVAAVAVAFARYLGIVWPGDAISETNYIVGPIRISAGYAVSLSTAQLVGLLMIALLTWMNARGLRLGKGPSLRAAQAQDQRAEPARRRPAGSFRLTISRNGAIVARRSWASPGLARSSYARSAARIASRQRGARWARPHAAADRFEITGLPDSSV